MTFSLPNFWENIISLGTLPTDKHGLREDIRTVNSTAIVNAFIDAFVGILSLYYFPSGKYLLIAIAFSLLYFCALPLNYFRKHDFAKLWLWFVAQGIIFWCASTFGFESQFHTLYIPYLLGGVLMHYKKSLSFTITLILITLVFNILLICTHFPLTLESDITPQMQYIAANILIIINILTVAGILIILMLRIKENQKIIKDSQAELKKKYEEIYKANQELDNFVYSVSHDLRAPIATSMGLMDLALDEKSIENVQKYIQLNQKTLSKLDYFIEDIMEYSRNSRMEIDINEIYFEDEINRIISKLMPEEKKDRIKIELTIKQHKNFYSDRRRIHFIIYNLISNAIRYQKSNNPNAYIHIWVEANEEKASIKVEDNGIGISQEHLAHVFNMFYRATKHSLGSGLGLYIVKEIIHKLNGKIEVISEIDKGSTFVAEIPNLNPYEVFSYILEK